MQALPRQIGQPFRTVAPAQVIGQFQPIPALDNRTENIKRNFTSGAGNHLVNRSGRHFQLSSGIKLPRTQTVNFAAPVTSVNFLIPHRKVQRQLRLFQQCQLCLSVDAAVVQPGSKTVELNFVIFHFKCQFRIFESITLPDQISDGKLPVQRKCLVKIIVELRFIPKRPGKEIGLIRAAALTQSNGGIGRTGSLCSLVIEKTLRLKSRNRQLSHDVRLGTALVNPKRALKVIGPDKSIHIRQFKNTAVSGQPAAQAEQPQGIALRAVIQIQCIDKSNKVRRFKIQVAVQQITVFAVAYLPAVHNIPAAQFGNNFHCRTVQIAGNDSLRTELLQIFQINSRLGEFKLINERIKIFGLDTVLQICHLRLFSETAQFTFRRQTRIGNAADGQLADIHHSLRQFEVKHRILKRHVLINTQIQRTPEIDIYVIQQSQTGKTIGHPFFQRFVEFFLRQTRQIIVKVNAVGCQRQIILRPFAADNAGLALENRFIQSQLKRRNLNIMQIAGNVGFSDGTTISRRSNRINFISQPGKKFLQIVRRSFTFQIIGQHLVIGKNVAFQTGFGFAGKDTA